MKWIYHDPQNSAYLDKLKAQSGFSDTLLLEKLVLDFEVHYHLQERFEMVVRGGMAALLHTGPSLQRISEDIDVMTTASKDQIISIINTLNEDSRELDISIEEGRTRLPERLIHCQTRCSSSSILKHCTAKWTFCVE